MMAKKPEGLSEDCIRNPRTKIKKPKLVWRDKIISLESKVNLLRSCFHIPANCGV